MTMAEEASNAAMRRVRSEEIKVIGKSGQISLGKSYAGKSLRWTPRIPARRPSSTWEPA